MIAIESCVVSEVDWALNALTILSYDSIVSSPIAKVSGMLDVLGRILEV